MTNTQKNVIISLAENDMRVSSVAEHLNYHRNTIIFHIKRINELYGLNPLRFYDLIQLLDMCELDKSE